MPTAWFLILVSQLTIRIKPKTIVLFLSLTLLLMVTVVPQFTAFGCPGTSPCPCPGC